MMKQHTDRPLFFRSRHVVVILAAILFLIISGIGLGLWLAQEKVLRVEGATSTNHRSLKILVPENGIYKLTAGDVTSVGLVDDPSRLHLYLRGQSQPFWSEGQGKNLKIYFYGRASNSVYTKANSYFLMEGIQAPGDKGESPTLETATSIPPRVDLTPHSFLDTLRLEQNNLYIPQVEEGDHWLWVSMPAPTSQTFEVNLNELVGGAGRLRVMVWASTEAPSLPDHHLSVSINGEQVVDERWDGKGRHLLQADIPQGIMIAGKNTIHIQAPGDLGVAADITALDWIEVDYPSLYSARDDRLEFVSPGGAANFQGFSGPVSVYDVTDPEAVRQVSTGEPQSPPFSGEIGHRYWAVGPQGYRRPSIMTIPVMEPDLKAPDNGADYIAIGPTDLLEPLKPLLDWRASQGYKTAAIPLEAVFDQFNNGMPEPEAIQAFMKYARQHWQPAPRYLLLVGDATYDPRGYQSSPENNRLPVFFVNTLYGGQTASDLPFSQLDDGLKPGLAVGRIPASQPRQVNILVQKILGYEKGLEKQGPGQASWRQRVLAVSDGQDATFRDDARGFLDQFNGSLQTELYAAEAGASGASQQIQQYFDQGYFLVSYFGHGSINMWGKDRLFSTDDVRALSNSDRLPLVITMTCLNGLFTHPKVESLAEAFLWQDTGGAVAVLAPTSLTLSNDQSLLSQPLVKALLAQPASRLGDALLSARQQMPVDSPDMQDVLQTFLLFGDPALKLRE